MSKKLQTYFPLIWEREEILREIKRRKELHAVFTSWTEEQQEEFLDFCTGVKGIKFLYDAFFKELMNPEYVPERLNDFLSLLLRRKVRLVSVLPNDSTRIADESSLLITDIVVELDDGSLANVEVQKIGYYFPGARSACYSSDLLLRQYKRIRSKKKKKFSYKDIKDVYTIVLFEKSSPEFHEFPDNYLHYFEQCSDTGLELDLLQKYFFIPLDIFREIYHNKEVNNKLEAWLAFFSMDDPEDVVRLIETYPEFRQIYHEAYEMCRNLEGIMGLFSEELRELDRNTVQLMIDDMQDELERKRELLAEIEKEVAENEKQLAENEKQLAENEKQLAESEKQLAYKEQQLEAAMKRIAELEARQK